MRAARCSAPWGCGPLEHQPSDQRIEPSCVDIDRIEPSGVEMDRRSRGAVVDDDLARDDHTRRGLLHMKAVTAGIGRLDPAGPARGRGPAAGQVRGPVERRIEINRGVDADQERRRGKRFLREVFATQSGPGRVRRAAEVGTFCRPLQLGCRHCVVGVGDARADKKHPTPSAAPSSSRRRCIIGPLTARSESWQIEGRKVGPDLTTAALLAGVTARQSVARCEIRTPSQAGRRGPKCERPEPMPDRT